MQRFDQYMAQCLYGSEGFYSSGKGLAGRRRDFLTSAEVGPLFGEVLCRWVHSIWCEQGKPDNFTVLDVGSGAGALLTALRAADRFESTWTVLGIDYGGDISPEEFAQNQTGYVDNTTVVIANELLDNLPFRILEKTESEIAELYVTANADAAQYHRESLQNGSVDPSDNNPPSQVMEYLQNASIGTRLPFLEQASLWVESILERKPAALLCLDYGVTLTHELLRGDWLRTYREHERSDNPLHEPGSWDITTDIAIDQLPEDPQVLTQAEFLQKWGIDGLVVEGKAIWEQEAARPTLHSFKMRSRANEAAALCDPASLGAFLVCEWL